MTRLTGKIGIPRLALLMTVCAFGAAALSAQSARPNLSRFSLSTGCGKTTVSTGLSKVESKDGRGIRRTYLLLVPKSYSPQRTYSLVLVFHGASSTAESSISWGLQNAQGAAESAIFVFPQGFSYQNGEIGWDDSPRGYDMRFFDNIVAEIESAYCIDTEEIFVAGFSWGGDFTTALGCARGDAIRAIAVNSSTDEFKDSANFHTYNHLPCPSRLHPAVRFEHAANADHAYPAPDFATTSQLFQFFNQCGATSKPAPSSAPVLSCRVFEGCARTYIECPFSPSIGHALPPNWAQDTWAFFAAFRKSDRDIAHYR